MIAARRILLVASLAVVFAAACNRPPNGPSPAGASIAGTVRSNTAGALAPGAAATALTVTVEGTDLTAVVESSGFFQISGVPSGNITLVFRDAVTNAIVEISNVRAGEVIEIVVRVSGSTATVVSEDRSTSKVSLCHVTGTGAYHLITVSTSAEGAHRAHGDGEIGDPVPAQPSQVFDSDCRPSGPAVQIEKLTNGEDADGAPGPRIAPGDPVVWEYVVTNTGTIELTNIVVADNDPAVAVTCPATNSLAPGQSVTCTASGTAVTGQYSNTGTVTVNVGSTPISISDSDSSHYFGGLVDEEEEGPKVSLCHRTGNGSYHLINVSKSAEPAHRAHGDGKIGEGVPGQPGKIFGSGCTVN